MEKDLFFYPLAWWMSGIKLFSKIAEYDTSRELLTDVFKSIADSLLEYIAYYINQMFANSTFLNKLQLADVSPMCKGRDSTLKMNFCL